MRYDTCGGLPSAPGRQAVATKHEERYTAACSGPRRQGSVRLACPRQSRSADFAPSTQPRSIAQSRFCAWQRCSASRASAVRRDCPD